MRVAVFTGSAIGPEAHVRAAEEFARELAEAGVGIVYGGGAVGLMGVVADAALAAAYSPPPRKWTASLESVGWEPRGCAAA